MLIFRNLDHDISEKVFYVFHPGHVFLSAIVIASLFELYSKKRNILVVLLIGCIGAVGVGTLSDSLIPYAGEVVLGMRIRFVVGNIVNGRGFSDLPCRHSLRDDRIDTAGMRAPNVALPPFSIPEPGALPTRLHLHSER